MKQKKLFLLFIMLLSCSNRMTEQVPPYIFQEI